MLLKAGEHSAEWAWDRDDVRQNIAHPRATVFDSYRSVDEKGQPFDGHHYLAVLNVPPQTISSLSIESVPGVEVSIQRISLANDELNEFYGVSSEEGSLRQIDRWRYIEDFGSTMVFENSSTLPRAWLVSDVRQLDRQDVLNAIRYSSLPDGKIFDPRKVALVEEPLELRRTVDTSGDVEIMRVAETEVIVKTIASMETFLVLSDVYYPGWRAFIDGNEARLYRTNYILRGVMVPSGTHNVVFTFQPKTFYWGSALTVFFSLVVVIMLLLSKVQPIQSKNAKALR